MSASAARPTAGPVGTATDRPPALDDRALFGHPRGLGLLFACEMWERFSFYGMRAFLILYLVNALRWDTPRATSLYGTYQMLVYLTGIAGGYLADRFIGTRRSLVIGGATIAAGHFVLAIPSMTAFYAGLALIVIGTGFFKPNASSMVGEIYPVGDARRDSGFTIFYVGINVGGFLGPLVCAALAQNPRYGWHWGFAAAGVGMVLGLITFFVFAPKYLPGVGVRRVRPVDAATPTEGAAAADSRAALHGGIGAALGLALGFLLGDHSALGALVGAIIGAALTISVLGSHGEERKRVVALFIVVFFVTLFWSAYEQTGSSMNLFADKHTDLATPGWLRPFYHPATVPSGWFQSVNSFFILLFAPLFAVMWSRLGRAGREPSTSLKMTFGLFLLALSFVFMMVAGTRADGGALVSPWWLIVAYAFQTFGELCCSPVGLSYVTKVAPVRFASLLMGVWFLSNAAAGKIAGWLAGYTPTPGETITPTGGLGGYLQQVSQSLHGFFSIFVMMSFAAAVLMLLCVPLLKRLTASVQA